ncbi:hypothetical protein ACQEU3_39090 [Spirillospora sp. CA-253888]
MVDNLAVRALGISAVAALLGLATAVHLAYGKCPDGSGPGGETVSGGLGTLRCRRPGRLPGLPPAVR